MALPIYVNQRLSAGMETSNVGLLWTFMLIRTHSYF